MTLQQLWSTNKAWSKYTTQVSKKHTIFWLDLNSNCVLLKKIYGNY